MVSMDLRRNRRRERRCWAISAASAPPPCNTSYCCGVIGGLSILISYPLYPPDNYRSKYRCDQGHTQSHPGPRKKLPARVTTAQNTRNIVKVTIATLRSAYARLGLRSTYGSTARASKTRPGTSTPPVLGGK